MTTSTIKLIAQLLDIRISNSFPRWNSIVDHTSYRPHSASLRPCFSYQWVECPICNTGPASYPANRGQLVMKRRRIDTETTIENLFRIRLSDHCSCFNGHKVDPSIYTYSGSLTQVDGPLTQVVQGGVQAVLSEMSITPGQMGTFTNGFCRPEDMGDGHDVMPQSDTLSSRRRDTSGFPCPKNSLSLELGDYPNGYQTILEIIKRMNDNYRFLAIHRISVDTKKRSFLVSVKGRGSRYCMYSNQVHTSNNVYFCVNVKRARIQVHCSDPDCKQEHAKTPMVERGITLAEKYNITAKFGIENTRTRWTMSSITAEEIVPLVPLVPLVQMSDAEIKRQNYEIKRQKYQASINGQ